MKGNKTNMVGLIELCIKGELYFIEDTFSDEVLSKIANVVKELSLKQDANIQDIIDELNTKLSLTVSLIPINKVIAI